MEENKNYELENMEEATEEIVEEAVEAVEEVAEAVEEVAEEAIEEIAEEPIYAIEVPKKKSKVGILIALIIGVLAIVAGVVTSQMEFNKYNKLGYINVSGKTVADLLVAQNTDLKTFLETYGLPEDMPESTYIETAQYCIPLNKFAELNGFEVGAFKEMLGIPAEVADDTPYGEAEAEIKLVDYIMGAGAVEMYGQEAVDAAINSIKEQYKLPENVTGETKWGEIRNIIHQAQYEQRIEAEKAEAADATTAE